jgi:hypothetical protein
MKTLCMLHTPRGALLLALAYAPETGCTFLWLGHRCFAFPRRESQGIGYGKAGW